MLPRLLCLWLLATFVSADVFKFALISDVHVGGELDNYKGEDTVELQHLRADIAEINQRAAKDPSLKFVVFTGDAADKGQPAQLNKFTDTMTALKLPWLPIVGNHDLLWWNSTYAEPVPAGDVRWSQSYADMVQKFPLGTMHSYTGKTVVYDTDPEVRHNVIFHNFAWSFDDVLFLGLDWNARSPGTHRVLTDAHIHDFPGGTLDWLNQTLSGFASARSNIAAGDSPFRSVVILQHHPFNCPAAVAWYACWADSRAQRFRDVIASHVAPPRSNGWNGHLPPLSSWAHLFAGHVHRWFDGPAFPTIADPSWKVLEQWETHATLLRVAVTFVTVTDGVITNMEAYQP